MNILKIFHKIFYLIFFVLLHLATPAAHAATVYDFVITDGVIETSGGFTGRGMGTLAATGTFTVTTTDTTLEFSNIVVSTTPSSTFVFPDYLGQFDGVAYVGSQSVPYLGIYNTYTASLVGGNLSIEGVFNEPSADGYQFNYTINAQANAVPIPGPVLLLMSGLGVLGFFKKSSMAV